ncbi:MAG TPA: Nif3-like dinuclear metal center hexameric protein [Kofleriaceae bacterium]|nr:Nif3-like dinuclear metal center hexameric protein [Kofleriaceae bacterium]
MTVRLGDVVSYLDETLAARTFRDYCPNGLQVEGAPEVDRVVTGVSANLDLFQKAAEVGADLVVVHHGLVWGGGIERVTGATARRLGFLLEHKMSLAAYHLPLDAHPRLGNNVGLADAIGLGAARRTFGDVRGVALGLSGAWPEPLSRDDAVARIAATVTGGAAPRFVFPFGPAKVRMVGLCSGAASDLLPAAAAAGCDLFLTGELAERAGDLARELQITLVAAGHYATETFGPRRLGDELAMKFPGLDTRFVPVPSPL